MLSLHLDGGGLLFGLDCFEAVAFADVEDACIIGINPSLSLRDISKEKCSVICAECEVLLILTKHATSQHFASFTIQWDLENMLYGQTFKECYFDEAITESNQSNLLFAQRSFLVSPFLELWLPNNEYDEAVLLEI